MPNFMPPEKANYFLKILSEKINWKQEEITVFGKTHLVPRETAWYGISSSTYVYSGIKHTPEPWIPELLDIKKVIEHFLPNTCFNSVLLNLYRNGNDKVGWHADDEISLGNQPIIASVSLGATRRFDLKHTSDPTQKLQLKLTSGSLLVMGGTLQENWLHQIPTQKKVLAPRINLTFRKII